MSEGTQRTHWEGCWRDPVHWKCAVARVEWLEERLSCQLPDTYTRRSERVRLAAAFGSGMLASEAGDGIHRDKDFIERVLRLADATLAALDATEREGASE